MREFVIPAGSPLLRSLRNVAEHNERTGMPSLCRLAFDMRETGGTANLVFPDSWPRWVD